MQTNFSKLQHLAVSALIALSAGCFFSNSSTAAETLVAQAEVGKPAPNFTLKNVDGKAVSLSDFKGKVVVLEWFDDKCPFDKKHYSGGNMQSLQKEYAKKGVEWLVICSAGQGKPGYHTVPEYKDMMKAWKFESPNFLPDNDGTVGHLYGAKTTPDMFVIGKNGTLLYSGAIDDHPDTDVESIKVSKNYVREALDQVLAGKPVTTSITKSYG
jgi:glutathione peroxidase-family protein